METKATINEPAAEKDYFPSLFANKDRSVVILADNRTSEKTFSGMIIHAAKEAAKRYATGTFSAGWTYDQFKRLPRGTKIEITLVQDGQ